MYARRLRISRVSGIAHYSVYETTGRGGPGASVTERGSRFSFPRFPVYSQDPLLKKIRLSHSQSTQELVLRTGSN